SGRRHTRSKRDWSSDVCSSDLNGIDILCFPIPNQSFSVGYLGRRYHISDKLRYVKMLLTNEFTIDSTFNPRKKKHGVRVLYHSIHFSIRIFLSINTLYRPTDEDLPAT